ncbi:MAG: MFS transporter [Solobacterium sp.]|nr:MFS transporter [Solobacterium sp.]
MFSFLLVIIYLAFISLGLPDALLGSAWPVMYTQFGAKITDAGTISMIISAMTIISSLNADRVIHRFGTGLVTTVSVGMTAAALFGFSLSRSFLSLCLWSIPYGLGAGAVDSALNNYVALHYSGRHMSWLHCCWGIGASLGPYVMGYCLSYHLGWPMGYRIIGGLQILLTTVLFMTLSRWHNTGSDSSVKTNVLSLKEIFALPGVKAILTAFLCYCAIETSAGLWASSYLNVSRGIDAEITVFWASLFYLGITAGRALSGFVADYFGDQGMIRIGEGILVTGILLVLLPLSDTLALIGLVVIGLGCAPIYPSVIHSTPDRFGKENSQSLVGVQMAAAYTGSTLFPKLFGLISNITGIGIYPVFLLLIAVIMIVMIEIAHR